MSDSPSTNFIFNTGVQDFIRLHENDDIQKFLLKHKEVLGVPAEWIARQLAARIKAKDKLPTWYRTPGIVFPHAVNLEQSSSEVTARFKASRIDRAASGADLTGGFGVDSFFLSQRCDRFDYVEPNDELLQTARHNHQVLEAGNISYHNLSAQKFLTQAGKLDFIYLDPSRRKGSHKVSRLVESEPDVIQLMDKLFLKTSSIIIKGSPLLDLQQGFRDLPFATKIIVLAVDNECKELLFFLQKGESGDPVIEAINLNRDGKVLDVCSFTWMDERNSVTTYSEPLSFLFEPNAALLKAGAFKWIASQHQLKKLAPNTHLYTSAIKKEDFPGRIFRVIEQAKLDKTLKARFSNGYVNILNRNYPLNVEEIKRKTGLKEGGEQYLIVTQSENRKYVLVAERLK